MANSLRPTVGHKRNQSSLATTTLSREKSQEESSISLLGSIGQKNISAGQPTSALNPVESTKHPGSLSLDQSVQAFKIFEILRIGESESIEKAMQENTNLQGTSILHLAVQCADPIVVEQVLDAGTDIDAQDKDGNSALHLAAILGRVELVKPLLRHKSDTTATNYQGQTALDLARTPAIFQLLYLERAIFTETQVAKIHGLVGHSDYDGLEKLLEDARTMSVLDVNAMELASDPSTIESGGTLLHEAARKRDHKLIQLLLLNGADPFRRDKKGRLPKDVTKDDKTRAILKKSPAATAAQRGIQERAILGSSQLGEKSMGRDSREIKGYLKKWTNYTSGYKLRWFVLEAGVLSYYKNQDDAGAACRGAMNMKIAKLSMDSQDKTRFEVVGKSSVKYHLKANHEVEAKRWFWALNNAIQYAKDEARQEEQNASNEAEAQRQAIHGQRTREEFSHESRASLIEPRTGHTSLLTATSINAPSIASKEAVQPSSKAPDSVTGGDFVTAFSYDPSLVAKESNAVQRGDIDEDDEYENDTSSHELYPASKDAFTITAQSVDLQLEILHQISQALFTQAKNKPDTLISEKDVEQAILAHLSAVQSLKSMVGDLQKITRDRDAYWQHRLDRETDMRRMWEESMAKIVQDQEELEGKMGQSEMKRKRTKQALREALEVKSADTMIDSTVVESVPQRRKSYGMKRRTTIATIADLSDSDSDFEEEFFDAVGAGEVSVQTMPMSASLQSFEPQKKESEKDVEKDSFLSSFVGYEDPVRERLSMDADDRPKISLWGILKSMIGKDMTKMTLPVSFNEPTSLLQRVAEDMEYVELLDTAAERIDSTERMVYVAAFAASEYASTIGRVAKPFNPLLSETYEYVRPDKGFRFLVEQVSHHPPVGAAWAESKKWTYYGESAVKSKFYGRAFDINPLGTWFLRLRPASGGEELFTWKKVTTSVIGIITGSPTVDNYGIMEVKNWTTGEVCTLDFKARGWKASSAYQVFGKVVDADGQPRWSIGGRWNDKIFARLTPGYEADSLEAVTGSDKAFLVWKANERPTGIPFNLTPFGVTLNAIPDGLRPCLPQTDSRLRPDQRAMEDGEYALAASEKNRLEEKQRAKRRIDEAEGIVHRPRWFQKAKCRTTGEEYWGTDGSYWNMRSETSNGGTWKDIDDIF